MVFNCSDYWSTGGSRDARPGSISCPCRGGLSGGWPWRREFGFGRATSERCCAGSQRRDRQGGEAAHPRGGPRRAGQRDGGHLREALGDGGRQRLSSARLEGPRPGWPVQGGGAGHAAGAPDVPGDGTGAGGRPGRHGRVLAKPERLPARGGPAHAARTAGKAPAGGPAGDLSGAAAQGLDARRAQPAGGAVPGRAHHGPWPWLRPPRGAGAPARAWAAHCGRAAPRGRRSCACTTSTAASTDVRGYGRTAG